MNKFVDMNSRIANPSLWLCITALFLMISAYNPTSAQVTDRSGAGLNFNPGSRVYFSNSSSILEKVDSKKWAELGADQQPRFYFDEIALQGYTITLKDHSRNMELTIDLAKKTANLNGNPFWTIDRTTMGPPARRTTKYVPQRPPTQQPQTQQPATITVLNDSNKPINVFYIKRIGGQRYGSATVNGHSKHVLNNAEGAISVGAYSNSLGLYSLRLNKRKLNVIFNSDNGLVEIQNQPQILEFKNKTNLNIRVKTTSHSDGSSMTFEVPANSTSRRYLYKKDIVSARFGGKHTFSVTGDGEVIMTPQSCVFVGHGSQSAPATGSGAINSGDFLVFKSGEGSKWIASTKKFSWNTGEAVTVSEKEVMNLKISKHGGGAIKDGDRITLDTGGMAIEASTGVFHHCWINKLQESNDRQFFTIRSKDGNLRHGHQQVGFEKDGWYAYPTSEGWLGLKPEPYYWNITRGQGH